MVKIDFKREWKHLYNPPKAKFSVVEVPSMQFLMLDGKGDPNTARSYREAIEALYAVAYTLKFMSKQDHGRDYIVMPLEGLWTSFGMKSELAPATTEDEWVERFSASDKDDWQWTMMIMQPAWVTQAMFKDACARAQEKSAPAALGNLRLETYTEGLAVQIMHIGPYAEEAPTLARMHLEYIPENGYVGVGWHHEIYLSDPRRTAPNKFKTVLRQPVKKVAR